MLRKFNLSIITLILLSNISFAQHLEVFAGGNRTDFYDLLSKKSEINTSYDAGFGASIGVTVGDLQIAKHRFRVGLSIDQFKGHLRIFEQTADGAIWINTELDKNVITLSLYPIEKLINKRLLLNIGVDVGLLLNETLVGSQKIYIDGTAQEYDLSEGLQKISSGMHTGLKGRIAYPIELSPEVFFVPAYSVYWGLTSEVDSYKNISQSFRNFLSVGFEWRLGPYIRYF